MDSLAAFLKLSNQYLNASKDYSCYAPNVSNTESFSVDWFDAIEVVLTVIESEMKDTKQDAEEGWWYSFQRETTTSTDTLNQVALLFFNS